MSHKEPHPCRQFFFLGGGGLFLPDIGYIEYLEIRCANFFVSKILEKKQNFLFSKKSIIICFVQMRDLKLFCNY